jgi:hypothetical protein
MSNINDGKTPPPPPHGMFVADPWRNLFALDPNNAKDDRLTDEQWEAERKKMDAAALQEFAERPVQQRLLLQQEDPRYIDNEIGFDERVASRVDVAQMLDESFTLDELQYWSRLLTTLRDLSLGELDETIDWEDWTPEMRRTLRGLFPTLQHLTISGHPETAGFLLEALPNLVAFTFISDKTETPKGRERERQCILTAIRAHPGLRYIRISKLTVNDIPLADTRLQILDSVFRDGTRNATMDMLLRIFHQTAQTREHKQVSNVRVIIAQPLTGINLEQARDVLQQWATKAPLFLGLFAPSLHYNAASEWGKLERELGAMASQAHKRNVKAHTWHALTACLASLRANRSHPLRDSILALAPAIAEMCSDWQLCELSRDVALEGEEVQQWFHTCMLQLRAILNTVNRSWLERRTETRYARAVITEVPAAAPAAAPAPMVIDARGSKRKSSD